MYFMRVKAVTILHKFILTLFKIYLTHTLSKISPTMTLLYSAVGIGDEKDAYLMENIFFVPEKARWSVISAAAHTPEIGTVIDVLSTN